MKRIVIILMYFRTDSGKLSCVLSSNLDLDMVCEVTCMSVEAYFSANFSFSSLLFSFCLKHTNYFLCSTISRHYFSRGGLA